MAVCEKSLIESLPRVIDERSFIPSHLKVYRIDHSFFSANQFQ